MRLTSVICGSAPPRGPRYIWVCASRLSLITDHFIRELIFAVLGLVGLPWFLSILGHPDEGIQGCNLFEMQRTPAVHHSTRSAVQIEVEPPSRHRKRTTASQTRHDRHTTVATWAEYINILSYLPSSLFPFHS
ncbi:uncharacterized protein BDV17DRAFT_256245 [Aspergillus undulatus]|uniref:uncharacterized protein n=1 Tax=Aspergillus undulatus TaxID=1810928 RepID=UPI003CCCB3AA